MLKEESEIYHLTILLPAPIYITLAIDFSPSKHQLVPYSTSLTNSEADTSPNQLGCLILRIPSPNSVFVCWGQGGGKVTPSEFLKQHRQQNISSLKGIGPGPTESLFLSFYTFKIPTSFFCSPSPRDDISFPQLLCLHNFRVAQSFLPSNICLNKLLIKFFLVKPLAWIILSDWILTDNDKIQRKGYILDDAEIREGFAQYMHFHWAMNDNFDVM